MINNYKVMLSSELGKCIEVEAEPLATLAFEQPFDGALEDTLLQESGGHAQPPVEQREHPQQLHHGQYVEEHTDGEQIFEDQFYKQRGWR